MAPIVTHDPTYVLTLERTALERATRIQELEKSNGRLQTALDAVMALLNEDWISHPAKAETLRRLQGVLREART